MDKESYSKPKASPKKEGKPEVKAPPLDATKLPYRDSGDVQNALNKAHRHSDTKQFLKIAEHFGVKYDSSDYLGFRKKVLAQANKTL
tara:strand:+ start:305 stop:565 length:261 start_codon:yes stop_codon:yes gene_type:complete